MAENKKVIIEIDVNSKGAIKTGNDAKKLVDEAVKSYEKSAKSVRDLTQLIKAYQAEAIKAGESSPIGQAFLQRAGQLHDRISDLRATTKAFGSDTAVFQGLIGGLQAVGAGFQSVVAVQQLFGKDSEDLQKALVKIQATMALTNSLQQIQASLQKETQLRIQLTMLAQKAKNAVDTNGIAIMSAYNGAMKAMTGQMSMATVATNVLNVATKALLGPIGIVMIAIGALVAGAVLLQDAFAKVNPINERALEIAHKRVEAQKAELAVIDLQTNELKFQGKTEREILEIKKNKTKEILASSMAELELQKLVTKEQVESAKKNKEILSDVITALSAPLVLFLKTIDLAGEAFGQNFGLAKGFTESTAGFFFDPDDMQEKADKTIAEMDLGVQELRSKYFGLQNDIKSIDEDAFKSSIERNKKLVEEKKKAQADLLKQEQEFLDHLHKVNEEARIEEEKKNAEQTQKVLDEHATRNGIILDSSKMLNDFMDENASNQVKRIQDENEQKRIALVNALDMQRNARIEEGEDEVAVNEEINNKIREVNDISRKNDLEAEKSFQRQKREIAVNAVVESLNQLKVIADDNANAQKAIAVAQATISTYQSASKAMTTYPFPLNLLASALTVGAGLVNVNKIISTDIPGHAVGGLVGAKDGKSIRRSNGDNILATVKTGEVILNKSQQSMLGGSETFRSIGVPGFATGGFVDGGFAQRAVSNEANQSFGLTDAFKNAISSLPPPVVSVEDIVLQTEKSTQVKQMAEI